MLRFLIRTTVYAGFFSEQPRVHHLQVLYVITCKGSEWSDQVSNLWKEVNEAKTVEVFYLNLSKIFDKIYDTGKEKSRTWNQRYNKLEQKISRCKHIKVIIGRI